MTSLPFQCQIYCEKISKLKVSGNLNCYMCTKYLPTSTRNTEICICRHLLPTIRAKLCHNLIRKYFSVHHFVFTRKLDRGLVASGYQSSGGALTCTVSFCFCAVSFCFCAVSFCLRAVSFVWVLKLFVCV